MLKAPASRPNQRLYILSDRISNTISYLIGMEEATGVVKHVVFGKFKDDVSPEKIDELIMEWANLVNFIEPLKDFHWGTDVSFENAEGFTHLFVSTFESTEGVAEYFDHPAHKEFGKKAMPCLEKFIVIDYKPTIAKQ
ncbi:putative protein Pop3 [Platanthera zijinensis]|uniref:Stress-response A/B barrel domain-containing protein n=1 Tax=Platanthera zijinensis TaxID=2320716 RepID=A0AAP0BXP1_9ASPA